MPDPTGHLFAVLAALRNYAPGRWLEVIARVVGRLGGTKALDRLTKAAEDEARCLQPWADR